MSMTNKGLKIMSLIYTQMVGIMTIALFWLFVFQLVSCALFSLPGILIASCLTGLYVAYLLYVQTKKLANSLLYVPLADVAQSLHATCEEVGMQGNDIRFRYAYTDDSIAMAMSDMVVIDPTIWQGLEADPEAVKTQTIITQHILPGLSEDKKKLRAALASLLSLSVQNFILKHELAHVLYAYTKKRILLSFCIAFFATTIALLAAYYAYAMCPGIIVFLLGVAVGFVSDLFLTSVGNLLVKARQEKNADLFAARHSTAKEIREAATFFEKHETYTQLYRTSQGIISYIPTILLSGHPTGACRAAYLRKFAGIV